jgi:hypothetical protein
MVTMAVVLIKPPSAGILMLQYRSVYHMPILTALCRLKYTSGREELETEDVVLLPKLSLRPCPRMRRPDGALLLRKDKGQPCRFEV